MSWRLAATAILVMGLLAVPAAAEPAPAASCLSALPQVQQVTAAGPRPLAGSTPVLFVHGINSGPGVWQPGSAQSIAGQVAAITGITAWTFSYARESLQWVTNPAIGPKLASAISCLAAESGRQVIIVGHSMGGLAAQYAIARNSAAGHTAALITIGTPFQGSQILTDFERALNSGLTGVTVPGVALAEAILSACAGAADHLDVNLCGIASVLRSPVGTALEAKSPAIANLPGWPASLPVTDTAGDISVSLQIGHLLGRRIDIGDGAVTLSSATAHDTAGPPTIRHCATSLSHILELGTNACFHTSLPDNAAIIKAVIAAISFASTPVLGLVSTDPFLSGFGRARPDEISLGDGPFGVDNLHWQSWGGTQAIGTGLADLWLGDDTSSNPSPRPGTVVAFDPGFCQGKYVYQGLEWYFPQDGQTFNPGTYYNTCTHQLTPGPSQIVYFPCCGLPVPDHGSPAGVHFAQYKPSTLGFDTTGIHIIEDATWLAWNQTDAIATGTAEINSCEPACAGGRYVKDPVTLTLSQPQLCRGTWYWSQAVWHFPANIPPGETQDFTDNILTC